MDPSQGTYDPTRNRPLILQASLSLSSFCLSPRTNSDDVAEPQTLNPVLVAAKVPLSLRIVCQGRSIARFARVPEASSPSTPIQTLTENLCNFAPQAELQEEFQRRPRDFSYTGLHSCSPEISDL